MATLQAIRKRISSVHHILHVTQAMEVVAGVRLRRLLHHLDHFRLYTNSSKKILDAVLSQTDDLHHPLLTPNSSSKVGIIVINSDKGLCGAFNQNIFRSADKFIAGHKNPYIISFGNKGIDHFSATGTPLYKSCHDWSKKLDAEHVGNLSRQLTDLYEKGEVKEIWAIHTHYKNMMSQSVVQTKLLPLDLSLKTDTPKKEYIFEQPPKELLESLLPHYFYITLQSILNDSYAAELASRVVSMKAATKNAKEMIESLTLERNKVRQAGITKEMLEITSGAEGLK